MSEVVDDTMDISVGDETNPVPLVAEDSNTTIMIVVIVVVVAIIAYLAMKRT